MTMWPQSEPPQDLPLVVKDVTEGWLTSALALHYPGVEVTSARHETILHGTATKIRVRARYNDLGRKALVNPVEFQAELNNCAVAPRFALAALDHDAFGRLAV